MTPIGARRPASAAEPASPIAKASAQGRSLDPAAAKTGQIPTIPKTAQDAQGTPKRFARSPIFRGTTAFDAEGVEAQFNAAAQNARVVGGQGSAIRGVQPRPKDLRIVQFRGQNFYTERGLYQGKPAHYLAAPDKLNRFRYLVDHSDPSGLRDEISFRDLKWAKIDAPQSEMDAWLAPLYGGDPYA
jgi:hypothetical protein